jgi:hypothetical protein
MMDNLAKFTMVIKRATPVAATAVVVAVAETAAPNAALAATAVFIVLITGHTTERINRLDFLIGRIVDSPGAVATSVNHAGEIAVEIALVLGTEV